MSDDRPDRAPLEAIAREVAEDWGVELGEPFSLSRYSFAAPAGGDAVLKVTPASDDESDHEADAFELWGGDGAVRVIRRDTGRRALLLERAIPGHDASGIPDDEATAVAIDIGRRLWRRAGAPFRPVTEHVRRWLDNTERERREGHELVGVARDLLERLAPREEVLVHGDFHHHNLLRHGGRWVAIDPKPYLAEPEFDIPSFLWNPLGAAGRRGTALPLERTLRRLAAFEAAGLDPWRMRAWTAIRGAYLGADEDEASTILRLLQ